MNVLFIDWPCFGKEDAISSLKQLGYDITLFLHKDYQEQISPAYNKAFQKMIAKKTYRFCFSFNFYPVVAENCRQHDIPYISIVYDNPFVFLYSYTIVYPTNYVYLFDKTEYLKLRDMGSTTVHYMVLPVNALKIRSLLDKEFDRKKLTCEISFVGSLYNESHNLFERLSGITEYTKGFLDAIMQAQSKIYGYNFLEELLQTNSILDDLSRVLPYESDCYGIETPEYIYANYFLCRKITSIERQQLLSSIAEHFPLKLKLFTLNKNVAIPQLYNMGIADYTSEMPYIFANSKINLNITLKSIQSGIPLRAMDIMGAGGFLLTNYQADFLDYFVPNEDFVYYSDPDDLLTKIEYYLSHEKERCEIAQNGYQKVLENHSFEKSFASIISLVFP